jgi:hypothetical protein
MQHPMQHPCHKFDADDQKVFKDWLRRTAMAYVALVLWLRRRRHGSGDDSSYDERRNGRWPIAAQPQKGMRLQAHENIAIAGTQAVPGGAQ